MNRARNAGFTFAVACLALALAPVSSQANSGDFNGGVAIGSSYAGVDAAPMDGLLVQGNVGIGTTSATDTLDVAGVSNLSVLELNGLQTPLTPQGRLTLSSGSAVLTSNLAAVTTLYYLPYNGQLAPIYGGTNWQEYNIGSAGLSLALSPTEQTAGKVFDVYLFNNSGTPTLCALYWGNNTSRSTSVGGGGSANVSVAQMNGIWTNNASIASGNCFNGATSYAVAQNQGTLLGSIYTLAANASTTLSASVTSGATSIPVAAAVTGLGVIGENYYEVLDTGANIEYVLVTSSWNSTTQTVVRGQLGTTAISHNSGAAVTVAGGQTAFICQPPQTSGGAAPVVALSNVYNKEDAKCVTQDGSANYTYSSAAWRQADGSVANTIAVLDTLEQNPVQVIHNDTMGAGTAGTLVYLGIKKDATNGSDYTSVVLSPTGTPGDNGINASAIATYYPGLGLHAYNAVEYCSAGTCKYNQGGDMTLSLQTRY